MSKRLWLLLVGAIVVLLSLGGGWFVFSIFNQTNLQTPAPSSSALPMAISPANVKFLENALNSPNKDVQGMALVPGQRALYDKQNAPAFSPGTTVKIDMKTFVGKGDYAYVEATLNGSQRHVLHLVRQNGTWYIFFEKGR